MNTEEEKEDKILEELNRRLDEEKAEKEETDINEEVEKRLKEERKKEVKPAYFKDKDDKKKKLAPKSKTPLYECPNCGSTNSRSLGEEETIYKIRGVLYSHVLYCNDCGRRFGVVKE